MKTRSSAVLMAVCLSATSMFAAPAAQRETGETRITVSVDANGNLRQSTSQEQRALASRATARPSIMRLPVTNAAGGGALSIDDSYDHMFVARTDAEGNIVIVCTDDHQAAAEISSSSVDTVLRLKNRPAAKRMAAERE